MPTSSADPEPPSVAVVVNRLGGIDVLRIVGVSTVVVSHIVAPPWVHQWLYPWNVPVFFVLSGYLWRPRRGFVDELRVRTRSLGVPYLVWFALIAAIVLAVPTRIGTFPLADLIGAALGGSAATGPFGTLWSVSALFFVSLLYRLLDRLPWYWQGVIALAAVGTAYLFGHQLAATPLGIGQAAPFLSLIIAGRGLAWVEPRLPHRLLLSLALLLVSAAVLAFVPTTSIDLKSGAWGTPGIELAVALMVSIALILIARRIALPTLASRVVSLVATGALVVVLGHLVVTYELRADGVGSLRIVVLALVVPWALATLVRLTPLSQPLTGMPRFRLRSRRTAPPPAQPDPVAS